MVFCGQCGLQIAPGVTRCPRCGAAVDTDVVAEDFHPDDATMASLPYATYNSQNPQTLQNSQQTNFQQLQSPQGPYTPGNPQKLVLRPDNYDEQGTHTGVPRHIEAPYYGQPPVQALTDTPYADYGPQSGDNHFTQTPHYADYATPGQYQRYQQAPATQRSKGRAASLIIILIGLLLILAAMVLFTLFHFGYIGGNTTTTSRTGNTNTTSTSTTNSPEQQGQAIVTQYYTDVNNKDYGPAYDLWQDGSKPTKTLNDLIKGYQYTNHVNLLITKTTVLGDGTVQVDVTLQADEQTSTGGTQQSAYQGYYIVGQQNGTWKIQKGFLNKVTT